VPIPPKPTAFAPDIPPPGVESNLVSFWAERPIIPSHGMRLQLFHTNAAQGEGSVESSKGWAERAPNSNTCPHFQVDRSGRAAMLLQTNRRGIGNATVTAHEGEHGDVSWWSIVIETADSGTLADPTISECTPEQAEKVAIILAYNAVVWPNITLEYPTEWWGPGSACHTEPFGYPYWTLFDGKICPGDKKKRQMRELILPRAREIKAAWTAPPPPPPPPPPDEEIDMRNNRILRHDNFRFLWIASTNTKQWAGSSGRDDNEIVNRWKLKIAEAGGDAGVWNLDDDPDMFAALGPVEGPRRGKLDPLGFRKTTT